MTLTISDDIVQSARLTEEEAKLEIAFRLFSLDRLTLAQASRLAEIDRLEFQHLLASRNIPLHYGEKELAEDMENLTVFRGR